MYRLKDKNVFDIFVKEKVAKIIGINGTTLRRIVNQKQDCSKVVAYSITKFLNKDAEIDEYFERVGE